MKRVNAYEITMREINALAEKNSVIYVKYYHKVKIVEWLKAFPNIPQNAILDIFTVFASLGVCNKDDPDAFPLVLDRDFKGLVHVFCLASYNKHEESPMTLTATQITRDLMGFVASQGSNYEYAFPHIRITTMIRQYISTSISPVILSNITNMSDPTNCNPSWIRILASVAQMFDIQITQKPIDKTFWVETDGSFLLNAKALNLRVAQNSADYLIKQMQIMYSSRFNVNVDHHHTVLIQNFHQYVVISTGREMTPEEWYYSVHHEDIINGERRISINGQMLSEEHGVYDPFNFVLRHWLTGHRLIVKSGGPAHPVSRFSTDHRINLIVDDWFRTNWILCKTHFGIVNDSTHPVVRSEEMRDRVAEWLYAQIMVNPITYTTNKLETIPMYEIITRLDVDPVMKDIAVQLCADKTLNATSITPNGIISYPSDIAPEMIESIDSFKGEIVNWFSPTPLVKGIGGYIANDFMCPISCEVLEDPVTFGGHVYERRFIETWLARDSTRSSPLTRQSCDKFGVPFRIETSNIEFIRQLENYKKRLSKMTTGAASE